MAKIDADVCIIGAGVVGCAIARELSRYNVDIVVCERAEDVCCGTSKANSGIVHAGFDAKPQTQMAKFNVEGAKMMPEVCKELSVPYVNNGSFVLCFSQDGIPHLEELLQQGKENGVEDLKILSGDEIREMEPCVSDEVVAGLWASTAGIVDPFVLTSAYAENAAVNGARFFFNAKVETVEQTEAGFNVKTQDDVFQVKSVVNAAGLFADDFYNAAKGQEKLHIGARRGSYVLLDKTAQPVPHATLFQLPSAFGKGVLVAPTCHGNTIVGPTAIDVDDKEATNTTAEELADVMEKARRSVPNLPLRQTITSFAGLRAHEQGHEFVIEEVEKAYIHLAGIESPGLTSAPALGSHVAHMVADRLGLQLKDSFDGSRAETPRFFEVDAATQQALLEQNPTYGTVVCRCEHVTQGEIEDVLSRPVPPTTLDGIKRRLRVGMGRCQGGFCSPLAMEVMADALDEDLRDIHKSGSHSAVVIGRSKEVLQ